MKCRAALVLAALLAGCGSKPQAPEWQMNAHGALQRYEASFLAGEQRAADADFLRARRELAATGQASLVARAELTRCALQVASLVFEPCAAFEPLRPDAGDAERAYAAYLAGERVAPGLLPPQHRGVAAGNASADALAGIKDPLSRLVAAGVLVRSGRGSPAVLQQAADTASAQGWRRPLLAWLGAQLQLAEKGGDTQSAERLRRRIALASAGPPSAAPTASGR
jgi:hypothetical protein